MKSLSGLSANQFENLTFDLVSELGLLNCVWRTPGRDAGRDIQGEWLISDLTGYTRLEQWYVECKRYSSAVGWPTVWEKIAFAQANDIDVLLVVTSSSLSPQAIDECAKWNLARRRPQVRYWGVHDLAQRLATQPGIAIKYGLSTNPKAEAAAALLPLTQVLVRYADTMAASDAFGSNSRWPIAAVQAIAELFSARLSDIEAGGRPVWLPFRAQQDGFEWLKHPEVLSSFGFDRCAVRALLSMVWGATKQTLDLEHRDTGVALSLSQGMSLSLMKDLQVVAFWGGIHLRFNRSKKELLLEQNSV